MTQFAITHPTLTGIAYLVTAAFVVLLAAFVIKLVQANNDIDSEMNRLNSDDNG